MEVKRLTREHYQSFLDAANTSFKCHEDNWFQKNYGHCTPFPAMARDDEIAKHLVCFVDGRVVGGLGAYPMDWVISDGQGANATVKMYGIGQVCCLPEYRGRGVMTALLTTIEREMREQGFTVGYLTGDRFRYGRYGYDFCGNAVVYTLDKHRFGAQPAKQCGLTVRTAGVANWQELDSVYNTLPSRALRDTRAWERQLTRENYHWYIGEMDGQRGYIAYADAKEIVEVYGDPAVVMAMCKDLLFRGSDSWLHVYYPMQNAAPDDMGRLLHDAASEVKVVTLGLAAVINSDALLASLSPVLETKLIGNGVKGDLHAAITAMPADTQLALTQRLLGYAHRPLPTALHGFAPVTPLMAWLSGADFI